MDRENIAIGDIVTGIYKTGKYIGEITDIRPQHYLVKIKAVVKHPMQGDLHNPKQSDVSFFHERKALAFNEQTNIPKNMVRPYEGEVKEYNDSLTAAITTLQQELTNLDTEWAELSLKAIAGLELEYSRYKK